jgi:hypothetical protein
VARRPLRQWLFAFVLAYVATVAALYVVRNGRPSSDSPSEAGSPPASVPSVAPKGARTGKALRGMPIPRPLSFSAVELNTATLAELVTIPGITETFAKQIVAGRPYRTLKDLERTGIPRAVLEQISPPAFIKITGTGDPLAPPGDPSPPTPPLRPRF